MEAASLVDVATEADGAPLTLKASTESKQICEEPKTFRSRAYQLEMLEESRKRNIIVAVSTGPW